MPVVCLQIQQQVRLEVAGLGRGGRFEREILKPARRRGGEMEHGARAQRSPHALRLVLPIDGDEVCCVNHDAKVGAAGKHRDARHTARCF